jgi:hypothetical protein
VYIGCVSILLKLTNICFIIFVDFGIYLLDYIYSQSYCTSSTSGCCYLLSIFREISVCHSLLFLVMFSVRQITKYVHSNTVLSYLVYRATHTRNSSKHKLILHKRCYVNNITQARITCSKFVCKCNPTSKYQKSTKNHITNIYQLQGNSHTPTVHQATEHFSK